MQVDDDDELHGGRRSTEVKILNNALWPPNLEKPLMQV